MSGPTEHPTGTGAVRPLIRSTVLLAAPREFFVEVDSLLSWIANRGWVIRDPDDRALAEKLIRQARGIYEANHEDHR